MKTHKTGSTTCPTCGKICDAASSDGNQSPAPGDFSICIDCQGLHVFDAELQLRHPTDAELAKLPLDVLSRFQAALTAVNKQRFGIQ